MVRGKINIDDIVKAIKSPTRRAILKRIVEKEMTTQEVYQSIKSKGDITIKYRESIYKELEKLLQWGIVTKRYDSNKKRFYYQAISKIIKIDISSNEIIF